MNNVTIIPICQGCNKPASELEEYIEAAREYETTPDKYVAKEEGTYNRENGHFLCTDCYIKAGMPAYKAPNQWICP